MKITDFLVVGDDGAEIFADTHGNNVAFLCKACGHPVLAVALENRRGSDEDHPATCRGCSRRYYLDIGEQARKLYIRSVEHA